MSRTISWEARNKWLDIGIELNLKKGDLDSIKARYNNNEDCFTEMLNLWLKTTPKPTLKDLQEALRKPAVGFDQLAEDLENEYLKNQAGLTPTKNISIKKFIASLHVLLIAVLLIGVYHTSTYTQVSVKDCYATGRGIEMAIVGEGANAVLYTVDPRGKAYHREVETVCELMHKSTGKRLDCKAKKIRGNQFQISYQPTSRGRHQLHIKVEGEHIKGSPFTITVIRKFGDPIATIPRVHPYSITLDQQGQMIIGERRNISIFNSSLKRLWSFGSPRSCPRQFENPQDIAVDSNGNLLVTDRLNHKIMKFSQDGSFITQVGKHGEGSLEFKDPHGVAIHPQNGLIYVSDTKNHRIQVINHNLTKCNNTFGTKGRKEGQLHEPYGLAFDSTGNVYVTDHQNHRIQVFTAEGEFLRQIGKEGVHEGELYYPSDITIDSEDIVYVTQTHFDYCRISLFTSEGKFLTSFKKMPEHINDHFDPRGIAVDQNGIVYVIDLPDIHLF